MKTRFITIPALALLLLAAADAGAVWINDPAPGFELTTLSNEKKAFAPGSGKVTFVNFWASWCPPCKEEFPELNKLAGEYTGKDVRVIAITLDKALANVNKFLEKAGEGPLSLEVVRDPEGKVARSYKARAMPISFIVDASGKVRFVHMGFQKGDEARWRQELDTLLAEKK